MMTPTFANIDGKDFSINNFTVNNATDNMTAMQLLDEKGGVKDIVTWYNDSGDPNYPAAWYLSDGETVAPYTLKPGEGVIINTDESDITVQSAGQIPGEIEHDVPGFIIFGNGSPVEISVNKLEITGATDNMTAMQLLDEKGGVKDIITWYNDSGDPSYPAGWYLSDGETVAPYTLKPGESVILNSDETGVKVTVPAALK